MNRSMGISLIDMEIWYNEVKKSWHWTKNGNLVIRHRHLEVKRVLTRGVLVVS